MRQVRPRLRPWPHQPFLQLSERSSADSACIEDPNNCRPGSVVLHRQSSLAACLSSVGNQCNVLDISATSFAQHFTGRSMPDLALATLLVGPELLSGIRGAARRSTRKFHSFSPGLPMHVSANVLPKPVRSLPRLPSAHPPGRQAGPDHGRRMGLPGPLP